MTHGKSRTPAYVSWTAMIARCLNPGHKSYGRYGGRGITVCDRWLVFENFLADMGEKPSLQHSLDRYPNGQGNYEPGNVRWATLREQRENHANNIVLTHNGTTQTLSRWADTMGIKCDTLNARVRAGWTTERTLTTPLQSGGRGKRRAGANNNHLAPEASQGVLKRKASAR